MRCRSKTTWWWWWWLWLRRSSTILARAPAKKDRWKQEEEEQQQQLGGSRALLLASSARQKRYYQMGSNRRSSSLVHPMPQQQQRQGGGGSVALRDAPAYSNRVFALLTCAAALLLAASLAASLSLVPHQNREEERLRIAVFEAQLSQYTQSLKQVLVRHEQTAMHFAHTFQALRAVMAMGDPSVLASFDAWLPYSVFWETLASQAVYFQRVWGVNPMEIWSIDPQTGRVSYDFSPDLSTGLGYSPIVEHSRRDEFEALVSEMYDSPDSQITRTAGQHFFAGDDLSPTPVPDYNSSYYIPVLHRYPARIPGNQARDTAFLDFEELYERAALTGKAVASPRFVQIGQDGLLTFGPDLTMAVYNTTPGNLGVPGDFSSLNNASFPDFPVNASRSAWDTYQETDVVGFIHLPLNGGKVLTVHPPFLEDMRVRLLDLNLTGNLNSRYALLADNRPTALDASSNFPIMNEGESVEDLVSSANGRDRHINIVEFGGRSYAFLIDAPLPDPDFLLGMTPAARNWIFVVVVDVFLVSMFVIFVLAELSRRQTLRIRQKNDENRNILLQQQATKNLINFILHDIRTPIHGISGALQLLEDGLFDEDASELVAVMKESCKIVSELSKGFLEFARLQQGRLALYKGWASLRKITESMRKVNKMAASEVGVALSFHIETDLRETQVVLLDEPRFTEVVVNLVTNALKFTPSGGEVSVLLKVCSQSHEKEHATPAQNTQDETFVDGADRESSVHKCPSSIEEGLGYVQKRLFGSNQRGGSRSQKRSLRTELPRFMTPRNNFSSKAMPLPPKESEEYPAADWTRVVITVSVADTGRGLPEDSDRLFDAFVQRQSGTAEDEDAALLKGVGLGLCICSQLVRLMDGTIAARNKDPPSTGSIFEFTIPSFAAEETVVTIEAVSAKSPLRLDPVRRSFCEQNLPHWPQMQHPFRSKQGQSRCHRGQGNSLMEDTAPPALDQVRSRSQLGSKRGRIVSRNDQGEGESILPPTQANMGAAILVVDDVLMNRKLMVKMLAKIGYSNVKCASDGLVGMEMIAKQHFDIILLDLHMPKMNGREVAHHCRALYAQVTMEQEILPNDASIASVGRIGMDTLVVDSYDLNVSKGKSSPRTGRFLKSSGFSDFLSNMKRSASTKCSPAGSPGRDLPSQLIPRSPPLIIACTAGDMEAIVGDEPSTGWEGEYYPFDGAITKPISMDELKDILQESLTRIL